MQDATNKSVASKVGTRPSHSDVIVFWNDPDCSVVEILSPKDSDVDNDPVRNIEAFCVRVEPRACSRVVKQLSSTLPLENCLAHLKRVRRRPLSSPNSSDSITESTIPQGHKKPNQDASTSKTKDDPENGPLETDSETSIASDRPKKRHKSNFVLEILIGSHSRLYVDGDTLAKDHPVVREFGPLHSVVVPKYEPRSEKEWKEHNASWPTLYHPLRFEEHRKQQLALSDSERNRMKELMERCISTRSVLIVDPKDYDPKQSSTSKNNENGNADDTNASDIGIVSISRAEQSLQHELSKRNQQQHTESSVSLLGNNPLATHILLALQGVSRRERQAKIKANGVKETKSVERDHEQQQRGQYICTGYDMFSFYEPNVFEAMACLHSRLRRLVYFVPSSKGGKSIDSVVWGRGISKHDVHNLAGTNHNYRAFEYRQSSYAP